MYEKGKLANQRAAVCDRIDEGDNWSGKLIIFCGVINKL